MKVSVKELLVNQAEWQKSRKTVSWGDKIRQSQRARETLGSYSYRGMETKSEVSSKRETYEGHMK